MKIRYFKYGDLMGKEVENEFGNKQTELRLLEIFNKLLSRFDIKSISFEYDDLSDDLFDEEIK